MLEELRAGSVHFTGLFLLAGYLNAHNFENLITEARGKTKRQIEMLLASRFPKPDLPDHVAKVPEQMAIGDAVSPGLPGPDEIRPGADLSSRPAGSSNTNAAAPPPATLPIRLEPLSAARWSIQLTASAEFHRKLERAQELLSHAVPSGNLAVILERALDALLERETKRLEGAGKPRKKRALKEGSRHIPVDIARAVRERDGNQCSFIDAQVRRCKARRFLTIEHKHPFALGGEPTLENLCLLCAAHNQDGARKVFGEAQVESRISERRALRKPGLEDNDVMAKTHSALCAMGFSKAESREALQRLASSEELVDVEATLRAALALLVPPARTAHSLQKKRDATPS